MASLAITRSPSATPFSFALATLLIASLRTPKRTVIAASFVEEGRKGFRAVLADRPYCWIVASNLVFGIARTMILVGFPVYAIQVLGAPAWLTGVLYAVYTCAASGRTDQLGASA